MSERTIHLVFVAADAATHGARRDRCDDCCSVVARRGSVLADYVHLHSRSICRCSYSSDRFRRSLQISSLQLQQLNRLFAALVLAIYMAVDLRSPDLRNYVMIFSYDGSC